MELLTKRCFYLGGRSEATDHSSRWSWIQPAEAPYNWALFIIIYLRLYTLSSIPLNISTIFQLYRTKLKLYQRFLIYQRFDTTYRFTDNLRQGQTNYIPSPLIRTNNNKNYRIYAIVYCTYAANASKASSASEPSVVIVIMLPVPIAKLIIPIMLFAFTVFPSFSMKISA